MRKILLIVLAALACESAAGSGFDRVILERLYHPTLNGKGFSFEPSRLCRPGYNAIFLHTNPYRIGALSWDFAAGRIGWRGLGFYASFRSYRLDDLYNDMTITVGAAAQIYRGAYISVSAARQREDFEGNDDFGGLTSDVRVSYDRGAVVVQAGLERMIIKNPYDISRGERSEPVFRASYFASEDISLTAAYRRDQFGRGRWAFGQAAAVTRGIWLRIGYMSNPSTLEWGLDLSYKTFTFIFDYRAANKLSDTVILGLSLGK
jgi:hypothetical protein